MNVYEVGRPPASLTRPRRRRRARRGPRPAGTKAVDARPSTSCSERRWSNTPAPGVIGRQQVARALVAAAGSARAKGKTFDLVVEHGPAQENLDALFADSRPTTSATSTRGGRE